MLWLGICCGAVVWIPNGVASVLLSGFLIATERRGNAAGVNDAYEIERNESDVHGSNSAQRSKSTDWEIGVHWHI